MGPQLGPLVVTALRIRVGNYDRARLRRLGKNAGIGDSKQVSAFGKMAWCESLALAAVELATGALPEDVDGFLQSVSVDSRAELMKRCPRSSKQQCWSGAITLPAWGGDIEAGRRMMARLGRWGVELERIRSRILCVQNFNRSICETGSKTTVDLAQMKMLLDDCQVQGADSSADPHIAVCGMVGGIRSYPRYWPLVDSLVKLSETRQRCSYSYRRFEEVAFEVSADDRHMPVALASMVGKYVRELWMLRQNTFYQANDPALPVASGYHDPITRAHISLSKPLRRRLRIADDCYLRAR